MEAEFLLPIDAAKFRSTHDAWKELMLDDPWSVGDVTTLIELKKFLVKEEWESFYYQSGEERERLIARWDDAMQATLQNESLIRTDKASVYDLNWNLQNLNTQFGRTQERLFQKGEILYNHIRNNGLGLSVEESFQCVRFRVVCETWNSVMMRERNTVVTLQRMFPHIEFRKVAGELDYTYAVDYEAYVNGALRCGLHIKPESYVGNATYVQNARHANSRKHQLYLARFGAPVYDIITDHKGDVINTEVLHNL